MGNSDYLIVTIAVLFSAFFSGMEIAFITSNKIRLEIIKRKKGLNSQILKLFTENPTQYISTMLVGNNIALVVYGIFMAKILEPKILVWVHNEFLILLLQTLISTLIILIVAEFLPKALFRMISNSSLRFFAGPIAVFYFLFFPIVRFSLQLAYFLSRVFLGVQLSREKTQPVIRKVDLDNIISESSENQNVDEDIDTELKIFQNALDFSAVKLRECMIPRTEIIAVEQDTSIENLTARFVETGFSKIFIYKESIDNIIGYVSSQDLFKAPKSIRKMIRKVPFVPETMPAQNLLKIFIKERKNLAVVVDEFGAISGIVAFEDILEEIFGEIEDEYDNVEMVAKKLSDGSFVFSGRMEIDALNEQFDFDLKENDEYETLAGYILHHHGSFPHKGEIITDLEDDGNCYEILRASDTRIELIKVTPVKKS